MEKINEMIEELFKLCRAENIALTISTTPESGKTNASMSGSFPGVIANCVAIRRATDRGLESVAHTHPAFRSLKDEFEKLCNEPDKEGCGPEEMHMGQIKSSEDLDFILNKLFGGK